MMEEGMMGTIFKSDECESVSREWRGGVGGQEGLTGGDPFTVLVRILHQVITGRNVIHFSLLKIYLNHSFPRME